MSTQQHVPLFATLMARSSNSGSFDVSSREVCLSSPEGSVTPFVYCHCSPMAGAQQAARIRSDIRLRTCLVLSPPCLPAMQRITSAASLFERLIQLLEYTCLGPIGPLHFLQDFHPRFFSAVVFVAVHGAYIVDADPSEICLAPSNFPSSAKRYLCQSDSALCLVFFLFSIQFKTTCN